MSETFLEHHHKKNVIALFVTLFAIALPLVSYKGIHLLLFNFYDSRFEFFFRAWEIGLAGLIALFFLFAITTILLFNFTYSRYFCGYICPKTLLKNFFVEMIEGKVFKILKVKNRLNEKNFQKDKLKTFFAYFMLAIVVLVGSIPIFFYLMPYDKFFEIAMDNFNGYTFLFYIWMLSALYLFAEVLFFKEFFCSYLCPYQLVNSISVNQERGFYNFFDKEKCIACEACVKVCPIEDLDVKKGYDSRCIACGDCSAVCSDVMQHEGNENSLIAYKNFHNEDSKPALSFGFKKYSFLLSLFTFLLALMLSNYLLSYDHLSSCKFSNAVLYEMK